MDVIEKNQLRILFKKYQLEKLELNLIKILNKNKYLGM